ncbi:Uncharacterised protein [Citrobacter koseri]|nr:Uncharacterised protein [Citrobacter koseri]
MNYDEITKITAERISDYMTEAVNTDSKSVAEMFHNAAWECYHCGLNSSQK